MVVDFPGGTKRCLTHWTKQPKKIPVYSTGKNTKQNHAQIMGLTVFSETGKTQGMFWLLELKMSVRMSFRLDALAKLRLFQTKGVNVTVTPLAYFSQNLSNLNLSILKFSFIYFDLFIYFNLLGGEETELYRVKTHCLP